MANPLRESDRIAREERVPTGEIDDEMMALDPERGEVFGFDPVATAIWKRIDPDTPIAALIDALVAEFDVARDRCATETLALLEELREAGLVHRVET